MNKQFFMDLIRLSNIDYDENLYNIVTIRNTDFNGNFIDDNGKNQCDSLYLIEPNFKNIHNYTARTYPSDYYLQRHVKGIARANYMASQYVAKAWRRGNHFGRRALVQNSSFLIWRSKDMELMDEDDYTEYNIVADNCHWDGYCSGSAGCTVITGASNKVTHEESGEWADFVKRIYGECMNQGFFSVGVFQHEDLQLETTARPGSTGITVKLIQKKLNIRADGDFGPMTFQAVKNIQHDNNLPDDGVVRTDTFKILGL